jgi:hypothetical protein
MNSLRRDPSFNESEEINIIGAIKLNQQEQYSEEDF